jgi:hypothetical protein
MRRGSALNAQGASRGALMADPLEGEQAATKDLGMKRLPSGTRRALIGIPYHRRIGTAICASTSPEVGFGERLGAGSSRRVLLPERHSAQRSRAASTADR